MTGDELAGPCRILWHTLAESPTNTVRSVRNNKEYPSDSGSSESLSKGCGCKACLGLTFCIEVRDHSSRP